jgi:hypothetical protein
MPFYNEEACDTGTSCESFPDTRASAPPFLRSPYPREAANRIPVPTRRIRCTDGAVVDSHASLLHGGR